MRREHPFNATTNRPACSGPVGTANLKTINVDVCTVLGPGGAALEVPQPGGSELNSRCGRSGCRTNYSLSEPCHLHLETCQLQERRKFDPYSGLTHQTYCGCRTPIRRRIDNRSQFDRRQQSQNGCRNRVIQKNRNPPMRRANTPPTLPPM